MVDLTRAGADRGVVEVATIDERRDYRHGWKRVRRTRLRLASKLEVPESLARHLDPFARRRGAGIRR